MQKISELTDALGSFRETIPTVSVMRWWIHVVPRKYAHVAWPVHLQGGVLTIHAESAPWMAELDMKRDALQKSVSKYAPDAGVNSVRVKVGSTEASLPLPKKQAPRAK